MLKTILDLLKSKKFVTAVLGGAVTAGMNLFGVSIEVQHQVIALISALILGQGLTSFGKETK